MRNTVSLSLLFHTTPLQIPKKNDVGDTLLSQSKAAENPSLSLRHDYITVVIRDADCSVVLARRRLAVGVKRMASFKKNIETERSKVGSPSRCESNERL